MEKKRILIEIEQTGTSAHVNYQTDNLNIFEKIGILRHYLKVAENEAIRIMEKSRTDEEE